MRISDWSSDVSLPILQLTSSSSNRERASPTRPDCPSYSVVVLAQWQLVSLHEVPVSPSIQVSQPFRPAWGEFGPLPVASLQETATRSEEHTSELQSLMRISYAVFCLKKKKRKINNKNTS